MSKWDEVGAALIDLATIRGGPKDVYKPVVRIEYYEHDECVRVEVGRCKGMETVVACADGMAEGSVLQNGPGYSQSDELAKCLLKMIAQAKAEAMSK